MTKRPNLKAVRYWIHDVALVRWVHTMEANAVVAAAHERNVFGVRPAKRHRSACRAPAFHSQMWQVRSVPNLLGKHPACVGKIFHRSDEWFWISTGREFIMAAFSC